MLKYQKFENIHKMTDLSHERKQTWKETCFPLTTSIYIKCSRECNKPGLGAPGYDPYDSSCDDGCACCCWPFALSLDIFCIPVRLIGGLFCSCFRKKSVVSN